MPRDARLVKKIRKGRHASTLKRNRQNQKRRLRNKHQRSTMRTAIKKVRSAIDARNKDAAQTALAHAIAIIDKTASKGIVPKKRASRYISRLTQAVKSI